MATDENDISDLMLEPMRERERARRGSDLPDEKRFSMLTRGEMPPPREEYVSPEKAVEIRDARTAEIRASQTPDISEPAAEPECPVTGVRPLPYPWDDPTRTVAEILALQLDLPMAVRMPTLPEMERAVVWLTDDGGLLKPYHRNEAARRLLRELEKMK